MLEQVRSFKETSKDSFSSSLMYQMNKNGKYGLFYEQLQYSVIRLVREKYLKTTNFVSEEEKKAFLESLYVFLMEEMHSALNATIIQNAPPKPEAIATVHEVRNAAEFAEKMGNLNEAEALWCELLVRDEGSVQNILKNIWINFHF